MIEQNTDLNFDKVRKYFYKNNPTDKIYWVDLLIESKDKVYTQIKIDEISNMGAVTIRLRSLLAIIDNKNVKNK